MSSVAAKASFLEYLVITKSIFYYINLVYYYFFGAAGEKDVNFLTMPTRFSKWGSDSKYGTLSPFCKEVALNGTWCLISSAITVA